MENLTPRQREIFDVALELFSINGYGKTSLLNLFYGILSVNLYKIKSIDFEKVEDGSCS